MSRPGKKPIELPNDVEVVIERGVVSVSGPRGKIDEKVPVGAGVEVEKGKWVLVKTKSRQIAGLVRANLANMIRGVREGWEKVLELSGTGYRAQVIGDDLQLGVGFSHPVVIGAPQGINFEVKENRIIVKGIDKVKVGQVAARIRAVRPADPYRAKGVKYEGEKIIRKTSKTGKMGTTVAGGGK